MRKNFKPKKNTVKKPPAVKAPPVKKCFEFHAISPLESVTDGTTLLQFTIPGQPTTKKTSQRIVRRGGFNYIIPSKLYMDYEAHCEKYCKEVWSDKGKDPINFGVSISMRVYLKSWIVGDQTGYAQAIFDILQKWGIVQNDSWLNIDNQGEHFFGGIDKTNPRVEIILTRCRHLKETFRAEQEKKETIRVSKIKPSP